MKKKTKVRTRTITQFVVEILFKVYVYVYTIYGGGIIYISCVYIPHISTSSVFVCNPWIK